MNDNTVDLDQTDEDILTYEVSDEALERAGADLGPNTLTLASTIRYLCC